MSSTTPERPPTDPARIRKWVYLDALTTLLQDLHGYAGPEAEPRVLSCPDYISTDEDFVMGKDITFIAGAETEDEQELTYNRLTTMGDVIVSRIFARFASMGPDYWARHAAYYAERAERYVAARDGLDVPDDA